MDRQQLDCEEYARRIQFHTDEVPEILVEWLERGDWQSCLDMGCGDGALLNALHRRGFFEGKSAYAADSSETRMDSVRKLDKGFNCLVCDACHTQLPDGSIDFLVSTQVIEHVESDADMVREIDRILSPKGTVYLSTVFKKRYGWYFYRCNGKWTIDPTHLREYTADGQLLPLFKRHGFELMENKKTLDSRPIVDAVLRRVGAGRNIYSNRLLRSMRKIRIPIPGYYNWEMVWRRK
jgi:2-polyprenyl-3-methyl-5-hydroxy-6-metoxy-1,4-benzoquinol methylase